MKVILSIFAILGWMWDGMQMGCNGADHCNKSSPQPAEKVQFAKLIPWARLLKVCIIFLFLLLISSGVLFLQSSFRDTQNLVESLCSKAAREHSLSSPTSLTRKFLQELSLNGTRPCHQMRTTSFELVGILHGIDDSQTSRILLLVDTPLTFMLVSMTANGTARCAGGDFYETELAGDRWRSRPPVTDHGNGSYSVSILVDRAFPGKYNFTANLLYYNYHGLGLDANDWAVQSWAKISKTVEFVFVVGYDGGKKQGKIAAGLKRCNREDMRFHDRDWTTGRWTRSEYNATCQASAEGRFNECLAASQTCKEPWCHGRVALLESNGWAYSGHCAFHIWEREEAWNCLSGRWLFFWGDSNMQDFIRNLLVFVLQVPVSSWGLGRSINQFFINPHRPDQALHISLVFNGHYDTDQNGLGLDSLLNPEYQQLLRDYFNGSFSPDAFIFNAGLHDGKHFPSLDSFVSALNRAVSFWTSIFAHKPPRDLVFRTTVAPAGASRYMQSNPHKMEVFNALMMEHFQQLGDLRIIDAYNASFPFHFDHCCSDGGHYGRAPNFKVWPWNGNPHQYFVDLMLVHMLLTSICPHHA